VGASASSQTIAAILAVSQKMKACEIDVRANTYFNFQYLVCDHLVWVMRGRPLAMVGPLAGQSRVGDYHRVLHFPRSRGLGCGAIDYALDRFFAGQAIAAVAEKL
jgi:hypothetical protein